MSRQEIAGFQRRGKEPLWWTNFSHGISKGSQTQSGHENEWDQLSTFKRAEIGRSEYGGGIGHLLNAVTIAPFWVKVIIDNTWKKNCRVGRTRGKIRLPSVRQRGKERGKVKGNKHWCEASQVTTHEVVHLMGVGQSKEKTWTCHVESQSFGEERLSKSTLSSFTGNNRM